MNGQLSLDDVDPPPDGDRDGRTYRPALDRDRLNRQAQAVWHVIRDGHWYTLAEIARRTGDPEASVSARLRDLRKPRYGSRVVARRRVPGGNGLHEYRWTGETLPPRKRATTPPPHCPTCTCEATP